MPLKRFTRLINLPPKPYIMQRHAGLLLFGFGAIAFVFPTTRGYMQLPPMIEWVLFVSNCLVGGGLLLTRNLKRLDILLLAAIACCWGNAAGWTLGLGINTATIVYVLEVYFLVRLLGRVRADQEIGAAFTQEAGHA